MIVLSIHCSSSINSDMLRYLVETFERSQAERESLRSATYPHEAGDWPIVSFLLDTQIGQSILTCKLLATFTPSLYHDHSPNTLRA